MPNAKHLIGRAEEIALLENQKTLAECNAWQLHNALSRAVMTEIAPQWTLDQKHQRAERFACYLSAEYLMGRMVYNNLYVMGVLDEVKAMLAEKGVDLAQLEDIEDAALGNGGLGRLAACFLDSAATEDIPLFGYGLRYQYGLFKQEFRDFRQYELPDDWEKFGDPWSIRREDRAVLVEMKRLTVKAVPYDMPIIGYQMKRIGTLRLWQCESLKPIDFEKFNESEYQKAVADKNAAEDITKLLYPNDNKKPGKKLRVKQQYVMCSATLQDLLRDFKALHGTDFAKFSDFHVLQLNDTHPAMAIPELVRLLQKEGVAFEDALAIAQKTFAYTNHTVMQEALEKWDPALLASVAPEMTAVLRKIDQKQHRELQAAGVKDESGLRIIQHGRAHMAYLAMYGSFAVNGVAEIHSEILKTDVLRDWYALRPEMFQNKTNGITQRRWLGLCNPELCALIESRIGEGFIQDLDKLVELRPFIEGDDALAQAFIQVKREKKRQLAAYLKEHEGVEIPDNFVFDVQVKRLHEYKRQLLNAFSILDIYFELKAGHLRDLPPVAMIFGAKSAPGYDRAKAVIYFINQIAQLVNNDPETNDRLRVVFVRNYNCSYAEKIIPAADISEQISPAGTEASGTGNMKLMLNGAVTLGTLDGANIEIVEQAGQENNYIFGAKLEDILAVQDTYDPKALYENDERIKRAVDALDSGLFKDEKGALKELKTSLLEGASWHKPDHYYLLLDFHAYLDAKLQAIRDTGEPIAFAKRCLYNVAGAGKFSSDRTVRQYAREIWHV